MPDEGISSSSLRWTSETGRFSATWAIALVLLAVSCVLMFARLNANALWDDEAHTALIGLGVWQTGDTSAVVGDNVVAYRGGAELSGLKQRYMPPLQHYIVAPFVGTLGAGAARLPFALIGMGTIVVLLRFAHRAGAHWGTWLLLAIAITGNVSLFLFSRQARYYAPTMLLSALLAYLYVFWRPGMRWPLAFAVVSLLLLSANYLDFVALYACLAVDYLLFGRREIRLGITQWAALLVPQLLLGLPIVLTWNPLGKGVVGFASDTPIRDRLMLAWWNLRDLVSCEFGVALLLLAAPIIALLLRRRWLLRASIALVVFTLAIVITTPQPKNVTIGADVRYLVPLIPLCIGIGVMVIRELWLRAGALPAVLLAVLAFHTNLLQLTWISEGVFSSWTIRYMRELMHPLQGPYGPTAAWIRQHVAPGQSVLVLPDFATYPLMAHAPEVHYVWQFPAERAKDYPSLPAWHFRRQQAPDWIIAFGPPVFGAQQPLPLADGTTVRYVIHDGIERYWKCPYRPELIWRSPREEYRPRMDQGEGVYILAPAGKN